MEKIAQEKYPPTYVTPGHSESNLSYSSPQKYILLVALHSYQQTKIYSTANKKKVYLLAIVKSDANTVKT